MRVRVIISLMPPWSSSQVDDREHADASDDGDRFSSSRRRVSPEPSSCAPSSRQPPSADDRDHQGATSRAPCGDDGADRSSPSACYLRRFQAATGSRSALPAPPCPGWPSRCFAVSASFLPSA